MLGFPIYACRGDRVRADAFEDFPASVQAVQRQLICSSAREYPCLGEATMQESRRSFTAWRFGSSVGRQSRWSVAPDSFLAEHSGQGLGLGDDEFSPINVPSLKHLWTNLKTQRAEEPDGYTFKLDASGPLAMRERKSVGRVRPSPLRMIDCSSRRRIESANGGQNSSYGVSATFRRNRQTSRCAPAEPFVAVALEKDLQEQSTQRSLRHAAGKPSERARLRGEKSKISDPDLCEPPCRLIHGRCSNRIYARPLAWNSI